MKISKVAVKFSLISIVLRLMAIFSLAGLVMRQRKNSFIREMDVKTRYFARVCREAIFPKKDIFQLHFALTEVLKEKGILYASIFDASGVILDHSMRNLIGSREEPAFMSRFKAAGETLIEEVMQEDHTYYEITVPLFIGDKKIGGVKTGFSDNSVRKALQEVKKNIIDISLAILTAGILATLISVRMLVKPINTLAEKAAEIGKGNLDVSINAVGNDEIGDLARTFQGMIKGLKEREFLQGTFGKYVNPEVARLALSGKMKLGGEKRTVTVLLSDIRDFSNIANTLDPDKLVNILNTYFNKMVSAIVSEGGGVDKYMGDAILSYFGAPLDLEDHAFKAVSAAVEMQKELIKMNNTRKLNFRMGIALHTGEVIAGNIGSNKKMEYTCIGDTVNTAAHMEKLNKKWDTSIIISEDTYNLVKDRIEARMMGEEIIKGKKTPINIYQLLQIL